MGSALFCPVLQEIQDRLLDLVVGVVSGKEAAQLFVFEGDACDVALLHFTEDAFDLFQSQALLLADLLHSLGLGDRRG